MARSLQTKHDERPSTSPLLSGFLLLSVAILIAAGFFTSAPDSEAAPANTVEAGISHP